MLSVAELQKIARRELSVLPLEESEREAELDLVLDKLTGLTCFKRLAYPDHKLDESILSNLAEIIERRKKREPIQYILGEAHFYETTFMVRPGVLIPRADTEVLVTAMSQHQKSGKIGEIGIGSGIISISHLLERPGCYASACDISAEAISVAAENSKRHGVEDRLKLFNCDWKEWLRLEGKTLDLLVSNPPYIPLGQKAELAPEVKDWEPETALFCGEDGLDFYRELAELASSSLRAETPIFFEIGFGQSKLIKDIFDKCDWMVFAVLPDLNAIERVMCLRHKSSRLSASFVNA